VSCARAEASLVGSGVSLVAGHACALTLGAGAFVRALRLLDRVPCY
jgi:hypothetical protein